MSAVGSIFGAISAHQSGREQERSLKAQGKEAHRLARVEGERLIGTQRVNLAASGVVVDEDTALDILSQTAEENELNALRAKFGFEIAEAGVEIQRKAAVVSGISSAVASIASFGIGLGSFGGGGATAATPAAPTVLG